MTMLDDETRRKLRELNLEDFIDAIDVQSKDISYSTMTFEERLKMAVDHLYQSKNNKKVKRLIRMSKFRIPNAAVTSIYYPDRGLDKEKLLSLATCQFIDTNSSIVFQGFTGSGKTYLACAMGKQACISGIRTRYIRVPDLLILRDEATLKEQGITKLLKKFSNYKLLILDEWLMDDLSVEEQHFLYELIERRYDCSSTIFCTQYQQVDWHERLGGDVHADAMMDRIVHNNVWVDAGQKNMRKFFGQQQMERQ
jgi:DNA replication protein DnaC